MEHQQCDRYDGDVFAYIAIRPKYRRVEHRQCNEYAEDVLEIEATELQSNVPPPPDFAQVTRLKTLDKAIKIELDESFVPKIISSMKKEPF